MKILVVCSGNTCRSPLGEVALRRALKAEGIDAEVSSAGTGTLGGDPASEGSYLVALEEGLDLADHVSRGITLSMVAGSDLVLGMTRSHVKRVELLGGKGKVFLFGEYGGKSGESAEVADPVGGPIEGYRRTFQDLSAMAAVIAKRLAQGARGGQR